MVQISAKRGEFGGIKVKIVAATLIVCLGISTLALAQRQALLDNAKARQETVQRAFQEISRGEYTGLTEKRLSRLGDSAAPELMKILTAKDLNAKDAETAIIVLKLSFSLPRNITHDDQKSPTNTLKLLHYVENHVADPAVKTKIVSTRKDFERKAGMPDPK